MPWNCTKAEAGAAINHVLGCKECKNFTDSNCNHDLTEMDHMFINVLGKMVADDVLSDPETGKQLMDTVVKNCSN